MLSWGKYDEEIAEVALGKTGRRLIEFILKLDSTHPDVLAILRQLFSNNYELIQQVDETFLLASLYRHLSVSHRFPKLVETFKLSDALDNPTFGVRAFNPVAKKEVRESRDVISVDLGALQRKGSQYWDRQPSDFKDYERLNHPFVEKIRELNDKSERYRSLGCSDLADTVTVESKHLTDNLEQQYFGFNRIPVTIAALIIAKKHGYKLKTSWDEFGSNIEISVGFQTYEARLYPFHQFRHLAPNTVLSMIEELENCPLGPLKGKSAFDDFLVLVPGIKGTSAVLDTVNPILLGEKDGKCFYICEWW
jgi:hypothetical protein